MGDSSTQPLTPGPGGLAVTKWENLPLSPDLLRAIAKYGIGPPNKIQARALPFLLKGSDIIAQAPPTQERIIAYVIPIVQLCLSLDMSTGPYKGPKAVVITTTVDQANQAHKLIRDLGAALGIRATLAVGAAGGDFSGDVRTICQNSAQVVVGTPARIHDIFAGPGGAASVPSAEVRLLILDEVDQLIALTFMNTYSTLSGCSLSPSHGAPITAAALESSVLLPSPVLRLPAAVPSTLECNPPSIPPVKRLFLP